MSRLPDDRVYLRSESVVFYRTRESFGALSNMASGFRLDVNGTIIPSSEALYQACRFPNRPDVQKQIISQRSPMAAKMKSKRHYPESRADWESIRVAVMRWCLRVKLAQHPESFGAQLLATGQRPIVEQSRRDRYWGAVPIDGEVLVGRNILGRLLMELRDQFRQEPRDSISVAPPPVSDFLLNGQPISRIGPDLGLIRQVDFPRSQTLDLFPAIREMREPEDGVATSEVRIEGEMPVAAVVALLRAIAERVGEVSDGAKTEIGVHLFGRFSVRLADELQEVARRSGFKANTS